MIYYNLTGSTVKSPLVPAGSNATHYDMFGVGGYREVDTLDDLHYINSKLLLIGCLVFVHKENEIYKYEGSGNFKILYYDRWLKLEECVKNIKALLEEDTKLWKAVNANIENINVLLLKVDTNTLNITELTNNLNSLDFKNYELSLNQSSDKNSIVLKYKKDNSTTTADLPIATKNTPGEIKLGDSTSLNSANTKNYPVLLDNNNRAYVNVPWKDTVTKSNTYKIAFKTPSKNIAHSIELSGSDNSTSSADIPIASETLLGEIKLGNPLLSSANKCYPLRYNDDDGAFVQVPWTDTVTNPENITTQFTSFVFTRSATNPGRPEGGTYNNPIPTNTNSKGELIWSDGIPDGDDPIWSSNAIFTSKNITSVIWSEPILLADSSSVDVCYSNSSTRPDPPTIHGTQNDSVWHNDAQTDDIWMAISTKTSVIKGWSNWEIFRIKGENGKNGNSIKIVGTYDNSGCGLTVTSSRIVNGISDSNIKFANSSHTLTVGDCLQVIDSCNPSYNGHIIVLTDNNPKTWIDLGGISGKNGKSNYIHVKWSNNVIPNAEGINTNENASFTEQNGKVPGIYRGEYVDDNPNDSTDINKYRWVRARGLDGFSYWFFYTATSINKKPESASIPTVNSVLDLLKASLTASDGTIWYDEIPTDTSIYDPETLYLWLIWVRDDLTDLTFKGPILYAAPSSDGVAYNIVVNNEGLYWSSDDNCLTMDSTGKNLIITVYKNESVLDINSSTEYTLEASVLNSDKSTNIPITIVNNSIIEFNDINPNIHYPLVFIDLNKSGHLVYEYLYNIPVEGRTGPLGIPGIPADTGITIMLSNDVAHLPCNPDNSPIEDTSVTTDIKVFKGDTDVTSDCNLVDSATSLNDQSVSSYTTNEGIITNTVSYSDEKYTLTSKLTPNTGTDTNYQYLVPIYVKYNNYIYTKYFTIRKDYTGDVYELIVTPQVYTDKDTDKTLNIKVNRTYSRTGHTTGIITSTLDSEYSNLKIAINDGNKLSIIGYTTTKLDQASFDVKLYEKDNLIDEEVVSRVAGSQGALGIQGCVLRNRGYWNSEVTDYVNEGEYAPKSATEIRYIDYVFLKDSSTDSTTPDKCYRVKYASELSSHSGSTDGKVTVPVGDNYKPSSNSEYWTEATSLEFAYIRDLVAELIDAKTITADEFLVKRNDNGSTKIIAGMVKGDVNKDKVDTNIVFFAGNDSTSADLTDLTKSKTYITEGGKLHSLDADITGNVQASRLIVEANPTNPSASENVTPSIIFTTYDDDTIIYSYKEDGTPITDSNNTNKPMSMSDFNNLKDSNGNKIENGSPIGIVYSLQSINSNKIYVPTYFFDFAPLTVKTGTAISVFNSVEGAATNSASSKFNIYLGTDSIYYSDSNLTVQYSGNFYVKYEFDNLITAVHSNNSAIYLLPYPSYVIFKFTMTGGKSGIYEGLYVYCTKYVDTYGNVNSTGVYLTNVFTLDTPLNVPTFVNSAYYYDSSSKWTLMKNYKLVSVSGPVEVGTTNMKFCINDSETTMVPPGFKRFYGTSATPSNLYDSNDATKLVLLFGVSSMIPDMSNSDPVLAVYFDNISLDTYK